MIRIIAGGARPSYLRSMRGVALLRFLTILAILLSPLAMIVHAPASASPLAASADHHAAGHHMATPYEAPAPVHDDHEPEGVSPDCAIACAALPAADDRIAAAPLASAAAVAVPRPSTLHGLGPEAETPPPRFS